MRGLVAFLVALPALAAGQGVQLDPHGAIAAAPAAIGRGHAARPLITPDGNTVAHLVWRNGALVDLKRNAWIQDGTVTQVAAAPPRPAGAGPFSDANYYSLGTGSDALDRTGDFLIAFVYTCSSLAADPILLQNGTANSGTSKAGFFVEACRINGPVINFMSGSISSGVGTATAAEATTTPNVLCVGRSGSTGVLKPNLGTIRTGAAGTITPGTSNVAKLGRYESTGNAFGNGAVLEVYVTATPASDALCTSISNGVKARLGISAW